MKTQPERILLSSIDAPRALDPSFAARLQDLIQSELFGVELSSLEQEGRSDHMSVAETTWELAQPHPVLSRPELRLRRLSQRARLIAAVLILGAGLTGAALYAASTGDPEQDIQSIPAFAQDTQSPATPAADASPDAASDPTDAITASSADVQSLLATAIGSDDLDTSTQLDWDNIYVTQFIMDPAGSYSTENTDITASNGIQAYSVVDGELTIASAGPTLFIPAGATEAGIERLDGPAEFVAAPGDSFVTGMDTVLEVSNPSDAPAEYVGAVLFNLSDGILGNNLPQEYYDAVEQYAIGKAAAPLPDGPISWYFDAIAIEPGGSISFAPSAGGNSVAVVTQGTLRYGRTGPDGTPIVGIADTIITGPRGVEMYVGSDQVIVLTNESADPAYLYLFRFAPESSGS